MRGTLRLNAPVSFGVREIAPLLPGFLKSHPGLSIDLGLNDRLVDPIEEGWDLVIRIAAMQSSSLIARRLAPCTTTVCASPAYLRERGTPRTVADLAQHNCLGYTLSQTQGTGRWLFGGAKEASVPINGSLNANNGDALVAAAVAGEGIVYAPVFLVAREVAAGLLIPIALDCAPIGPAGIYAVHAAGRRPPAKVRAFIDYLAKCFSPVPEWDRIYSQAAAQVESKNEENRG